MLDYDDPILLARSVARSSRPLLLGLDVDGVLAPIVRHANEARLTDGVADSIRALAGHDWLRVAIVSGRAVDDLARFDFDSRATLVGSHGMEIKGKVMAPLDAREVNRLARLAALGDQAILRAGDGAWLETKPASVVVHVRQASSPAGPDALEWLRPLAMAIEGTHVKAGSAILELFARDGDKGQAMLKLRDDFSASVVVFVGDDLTDEEAFAALGPADITIKVGDAPTLAAHRLRDPGAVREWLRELELAVT